VKSQGHTAVKYILIGALGLITALVGIKELGFSPTKVTSPGASVELKRGPAPQSTDPLEPRVRDLEKQLNSGQYRMRADIGDAASPAGGSRLRVRHTEKTQSPTDEEFLADSTAKLKKGNLAYSTPQKMKMGHTEHVTARIGGGNVSVDALEAGLPAGNDRALAVTGTPVTTGMKMTLRSADFDITPLSSEEQVVGGKAPTTWEWDIVPKHAGQLRLHLAAIILLKNLSRDFTAVDRDIAVRVDPVDVVTNFVEGNWQWIIGTFTAIGGAAWKVLKDRRKKSEPAAA